MQKTPLTPKELARLDFPAGVTYDPLTCQVTATSPCLLNRAYCLLRLGFYCMDRSSKRIIVYGPTQATEEMGGFWLRSYTAAGFR